MKNSDITIDILLATYNGETYLLAQIESLKKQLHKNWRLWVRDDCSTDSTLEILKHEQLTDDRVREINVGDENLGPSGSFSWLIENLPESAKYIMFCDQDDYWHPDKISRTLDKLIEIENGDSELPVLVHTDLTVVDETLKEIAPSFWNYQGLDVGCKDISRLMIQNNITGCTIMMNRALTDLALPVPQDSMMHDWWCGLVCSVFGEIGIVDEALMDYRQHSANDTGAKEYHYEFKFKIPNVIGYLTSEKAMQCRHDVMLTVKQMAAFKAQYEMRLDKQTLKLINGFARFGEYNFISRRYFLLRHGVLRQGVIRNLGLMVSI